MLLVKNKLLILVRVPCFMDPSLVRKFFLGIFILVGVGVTLIGVWHVWDDIQTGTWTETTGIITSTEVILKKTGRNYNYFPLLHYQYNFDGKTYEGSSPPPSKGFSIENHSLQKYLAEQAIAEYPVGTSFPLYVDPTNPQKSSMTNGIKLGSLMNVGYGLLFLAFVAIGAYIVKKRMAKANAS